MEQILDGAAEAFAERGFHGASIDNIAGRVGLTKGAFQSSFRSKEELFLALYDRMSRTIRERLAEALSLITDDGSSVTDALRSFAQRYPLDRDWYLLNAEFTLYAIRQPSVAPMLAERRQWLLGDISDAIEAFLLRNRRRLRVRPEHLARLLLAIYDGNLGQSLVDPNAVRPGELLIDFGDTLMQSVSISEPDPGRVARRGGEA